MPRTTVQRRNLILRRLRATAALAGALAVIGGPALSQAASPTAGGYPNSIVLLGHSGAIGQNSDPSRPPEGRIVGAKVELLDKDIHGYEAGCHRFKQCRYDGGAAGNIVDKRSFVSSDLNHFSIAGNAKAAAVAWAAMQRMGVIPRDTP